MQEKDPCSLLCRAITKYSARVSKGAAVGGNSKKLSINRLAYNKDTLNRLVSLYNTAVNATPKVHRQVVFSLMDWINLCLSVCESPEIQFVVSEDNVFKTSTFRDTFGTDVSAYFTKWKFILTELKESFSSTKYISPIQGGAQSDPIEDLYLYEIPKKADPEPEQKQPEAIQMVVLPDRSANELVLGDRKHLDIQCSAALSFSMGFDADRADIASVVSALKESLPGLELDANNYITYTETIELGESFPAACSVLNAQSKIDEAAKKAEKVYDAVYGMLKIQKTIKELKN